MKKEIASLIVSLVIGILGFCTAVGFDRDYVNHVGVPFILELIVTISTIAVALASGVVAAMAFYCFLVEEEEIVRILKEQAEQDSIAANSSMFLRHQMYD